MTPRVGCVVMAAGNGARFGSNKLLAELEGRSLIRRALDAVPAEMLRAAVVVTQYPAVEALARGRGFQVVVNDRPDWGASYTVRLGLTALGDVDGAMFLVSDQPLLRRETVAGALGRFLGHPDRIVALGCDGRRGNPCIFPRKFFPELLALEGDRGGSAVIRAHPEALLLYPASAEELRDVDTVLALEGLRSRPEQLGDITKP